MVLDVASRPRPVLSAPAESRQVVKLRMAGRHFLKLIAIVNSLLMACSVDQPELPAQDALRIAEQPLHITAKGRHSGSRADEERILQRIAQSEEPVRPMKADGFA